MTIDNSLSALRGKPGHRCPWWLGWALASPLRRLVEKPERLLAGLIEPGSQVLEAGRIREFADQPLATLKHLILNIPVAADLSEALDSRVTGLFGTQQVRLRSSTNTEELPDFSGPEALALDIEFKFVGPDRQLVIQQACPFVK